MFERRCWARGVAAVAVGVLAAASAGAVGQEPVTLYVWMAPWEMAKSADAVRDFEHLRDGRDGRPPIRVVMGQSAEFDINSSGQRLVCAVAGGDPPDVVWFPRHTVGEWAARGAFHSLQPFLERDQRDRPHDPLTLWEEQFYPPCWNEGSYEGQLYALPVDTDNRALYYNLDLLEKHADALIAAGCVDPEDPTRPGPPRTWTQLREAARILTEYDGQGKLSRVGFIPNFGNSWLYIYGWLNGGEFLSPDGRTCLLNTAPIVDALAYMTEMYDSMGGAKAVYAFQQANSSGADLDPFLTGKVAMKIDGNWFLNTVALYKRDMRFRVAPAPAPEGRPQFGWCGGWSYVIPKNAPHPEEAWELLKYMLSRRAYEIQTVAARQQASAQGSLFIPAIHARRDHMDWMMREVFLPDPAVDDTFKVAMQTFLDGLPMSRFRPVTPVGELLWNEQVRAMEQGIYKRYAPHDIRLNAQMALDRSAAVVQAELDRIFEPRDRPVLRWPPIVAAYGVLLVLGFFAIRRFFGGDVSAKGYFRREFRAGYAFALPWFIGFAVFGGGPILFSLFMSFCEYDVLNPPRWVGLGNYAELFHDKLFYKSLGNTVYMGLSVPLSMAVGLGIAMLLNFEVKGMAVYRTLFYLPAIVPAVASSILWAWMLNPEQGMINLLLARIGIDGPAWLLDEHWAKPAIILMLLWGAGAGMIVWLAGLKGIPEHLYEAARIDGAGRLRQFWNVTLPMLSPYIFFNLIMGMIGVFQIFTQAFIMTQGGPIDATLFYALALFNQAFRYMHMGYASAMAWVLFAIVFALTLLQIRISGRWVHYESEN